MGALTGTSNNNGIPKSSKDTGGLGKRNGCCCCGCDGSPPPTTRGAVTPPGR